MARQDDDNYWTSSGTKGFDFDSDDNIQGNFSDLFGVPVSSYTTFSSSAQTLANHNEKSPRPPQVLSSRPSTSSYSKEIDVMSISSNSSTGSNIRTSQPNQQCLITNKLLTSTVQVESVLTPKDIIRSLFLGLTVDLSCFKKLSDKTVLLDEAIKLGDGDVMTTILLLLQRTLHSSVLYSILKDRSTASQQYLDILEKQGRHKEAAELCIELKHPRQAAVYYYSSCLKEKDQKLLTELESLRRNQFSQLSGIDLELEMLNQHIQLLERQLPIAADDARNKKIEPDQKLCPLLGPPVSPASLVDCSLLATLQYCSRYHWNAPETLFASPTSLRKMFGLTDRQFIWNAFIGLILSGGDPYPVLVVKSLFGAPKIAGGLSVSRLLEIAWRLSGPVTLMDQLLHLVDDPQERCRLARKYQRHKIVADVLISKRDRLSLLRYRESVKDQGVIDYIDDALKASTKWK